MGGVRNGNGDAEPGASGARQETLAVNALPPGSGRDVNERVEAHLLVAARLLRERQAPKAFGELVRASRTLPMTRRLAAALVTVSLRAGTEAAAITILSSALDKVEGKGRRDVQRQLARVLRRVDQLPRAIEALESLLEAFPDDHGSRRVHQSLLQRTGKWEVLVLSLEREAQEAFQRGEYARASRAARWRARVQAEQMRNLARAAESYGQAANYLEQMEDAGGAFSVRLDGLRVLHTSGASEAVLTAAASVVMSAAARLGRDAQARQLLEDLGLIPARLELPASQPAPAEAPRAESTPAEAPQAAQPAGEPTATPEAPKVEAAPTPEARAATPETPKAEAAVTPETPKAEAAATPEAQSMVAEPSPETPAVAAEAPKTEAASTAETPSSTAETPSSTAEAPSSTAEAPSSTAGTSSAGAETPEPVAASAPESPPVEPAASEVVAAAVSERPSTEAETPESVAAPAPEASSVEAETPESVAAAAPESPSAEPEAREETAVPAPGTPLAETEPPTTEVDVAQPKAGATLHRDFSGPSPWDEGEATEAGAPRQSAQEQSAGAEELLAPAEEDEEGSELDAAEGAPLTELMEIPDEDSEHSAPPVALGEDDEEPAPRAGPPAPPPPPVAEQDEEGAWQRREAYLIARKAWPELAQLYLARADQARDPELRAEALTRLAEVMENELNDPSGAARMYREIVTLTGDRTALKEQVRLLSQRGEPTLVRRALDEAVKGARTPKDRAAAYLTRAERSLEVGEHHQAKADFETAEALTPGMLLVLAGLLRCVPDAERPTIANRLRSALSAIPRRAPDRLDALRVLATVAEEQLKDARLAQWAWSEVLAEAPEEDRARTRLLELARTLDDKAGLSQLLRDQLARDPRGPAARQARMELVSTLEASGNEEGALAELRQAVRFEPGHKEAWLLLADRLAARGQIGEAAWALEHAVTAMEDEADRQQAWARLADFCREVLKDPARAEVYARRAEKLRQALEERDVAPIPATPKSAPPRQEQSGARPQLLIPPPASLDLTPTGQGFPPGLDEPATDTHDPVPVPPPDDARPTIEFAIPEDVSPVTEPVTLPKAAPPKATKSKATKSKGGGSKATPPKAAPPKPESQKHVGADLLEAARALDELLGDEEEEDSNTSPFLSAWSMRVPGTVKPGPGGGKAAKAQKAAAPAPSSEEESTGKTRKVRPEALASKPAPERARSEVPPPPSVAKRETKEAPTSKNPEPADSPFSKVSPSEPEGSPPALGGALVQNTAFISWEAPPGKMEPVRRIARSRGGGTSASKSLPPEPSTSEPLVFQMVRERPLEAGLYAQIAHYFEGRGDMARASLMREIADALEGREGAPPRAPRKPLSTEERSGLRHPLLRTPPGELLACVGVALCRLYPAYGRGAGTNEPLDPDLGPGAPSALDALEATEHLLGAQAPEVVLSEENGPPFSLVYTSTSRLLVGKQAVRQVLPAAELRFYAGRAIACLSPDLLALRSLKKDQILRGLALLSSVLKDPRASGPEARVVRETLSSRQVEQAAALFDVATRQFDVSALADAARDSANRAGLIACGGVGSVLAALRMKRALEREVVELVRFAASERYFQLRTSR
jgi:tetratricopeptide (TPR) repeat protein